MRGKNGGGWLMVLLVLLLVVLLLLPEEGCASMGKGKSRSRSRSRARGHEENAKWSDDGGNGRHDRIDKLPSLDFKPSFAMYSGYVEVDHEHSGKLFYWLSESQSDPAKDPILIWLSGGPGCSSEVALFNENGPFHFDEKHPEKLVENEYSWNKRTNLVFVDQPVGTGFSVVDDNGLVSSEEQVGGEMRRFILGFLRKHPRFQNNDIYLFGESYAGHYVPATARIILEHNKKSSDDERVNLKAIGVGNGMVDPIIQYGSYAPFSYYHGLIDLDLYHELQAQYTECKRSIQNGDSHVLDGNFHKRFATFSGSPFETTLKCNGIISKIKRAQGSLHVYDISKQCPPNNPLCYDFSAMKAYAARSEVKRALHVDPKAKWEECNMEVHSKFNSDWWISQKKSVEMVLKEIPVLFYNGNNDFICNFVGTDRWLRAMKWEHQQDFNKAPRTPWKVDSETHGYLKKYGNLYFLVVEQAGHMVPMDQPKASLRMLDSFLKGSL